MVTASHIVQKLMNDSPLLQEATRIGIASPTLLAKYLKPDIEKELGKKIKLEAISQAVRRYTEKLNEKQKQFELNFFKGIKLDSDISYIIVHESPSTLDKLQRLYYEIDFDKGGFFNILQGSHEIGIITNKDFKDKILDILGDEKISHVVDDHISISLTHSKDYSSTPGVIYGVSRQLAWRNINILTWLHTPTELTLIIHERDATKCYDILKKMLKNHKMNGLDPVQVVM